MKIDFKSINIGKYLAWSNDSRYPLWFHGNGVGCSSPLDAFTDWSKANRSAPPPAAATPNEASN